MGEKVDFLTGHGHGKTAQAVDTKIYSKIFETSVLLGGGLEIVLLQVRLLHSVDCE